MRTQASGVGTDVTTDGYFRMYGVTKSSSAATPRDTFICYGYNSKILSTSGGIERGKTAAGARAYIEEASAGAEPLGDENGGFGNGLPLGSQ